MENHHVAAQVDETVVGECIQEKRKTPGFGARVAHEPPHHRRLEPRYSPGKEDKYVYTTQRPEQLFSFIQIGPPFSYLFSKVASFPTKNNNSLYKVCKHVCTNLESPQPSPKDLIFVFIASSLMFSYCHTAHAATLAPPNPTVNKAGRAKKKFLI